MFEKIKIIFPGDFKEPRACIFCGYKAQMEEDMNVLHFTTIDLRIFSILSSISHKGK